MPFKFDIPELDGDVEVTEGRVGNWIRQMKAYLDDEMEALMLKQMGLPIKVKPSKASDAKFHESAMFFYFKVEDKNIGFAVCTPGMYKGVVWISSFYVRREYRAEGIGTKSLIQLKELLQAKGYQRVMLQVNALNETAVHLYQKNGIDTTVSYTLTGKL